MYVCLGAGPVPRTHTLVPRLAPLPGTIARLAEQDWDSVAVTGAVIQVGTPPHYPLARVAP